MVGILQQQWWGLGPIYVGDYGLTFYELPFLVWAFKKFEWCKIGNWKCHISVNNWRGIKLLGMHHGCSAAETLKGNIEAL